MTFLYHPVSPRQKGGSLSILLDRSRPSSTIYDKLTANSRIMALSPLLQDAAALVTRENQRVVDTIGDKDPLPYRPLISINGAQYFPEPYSSPRLTPGQRVGMIPIASLGTLSVISTLCLIAFILSRMINWKGHYRTWVGYNQYVVLVLSLLVADLVQGSGFVVSWFWIRIDMILAPSSACFAQGWLLHSGDISSGFFVLAIALHTYYTVVHGKRIGNKTFVGIVVGIWIWSIAITAAGVWMHGSQRYFTAAGSWCWVSPAFETERLWCHYVWIFAIEASTILIYSITFLFLRRKTRQLMAAEANYNNNCTPPGSGSGSSRSRRPETATIQAVNRIARLMVFYPLIYLMLTLPLSAGKAVPWTTTTETNNKKMLTQKNQDACGPCPAAPAPPVPYTPPSPAPSSPPAAGSTLYSTPPLANACSRIPCPPLLVLMLLLLTVAITATATAKSMKNVCFLHGIARLPQRCNR